MACNRLRFCRQRLSAPKIVSKVVDVFDAVANVGAILPHPVESEIPDRTRFGSEPFGVRGYANLNDCSFVNCDVLKRLENAIFILRVDGHRRLFQVVEKRGLLTSG